MSTDTSPRPKSTAPEILTGSGAILRSLEHLGISDVFGLPGGAIMPFYDELMASTSIRHILVRHEQGAGHAAEGYASSTGKIGVAIATSGPGATNLVTAIADAYMDSVPLLAITGQVFSTSMGTDAFQEVDIVGITMPITKHSFLVTRAEDVPATLAAAYHIATTGRPGPVLVDVTKDAQHVTVNSVDEAVALMKAGKIDAIALSRESLSGLAGVLPGLKTLDGGFLNSTTAVAVPKGKPAALAYVSAFIEEAKASGEVRAAFDRIGLISSVVAPAGMAP